MHLEIEFMLFWNLSLSGLDNSQCLLTRSRSIRRRLIQHQKATSDVYHQQWCRASPECAVFEVKCCSRIACVHEWCVSCCHPLLYFPCWSIIIAPPIFVVTERVAWNQCLTIQWWKSTGHSHSVPVSRITSSTFRFQWLPRSDAHMYHCQSTFSVHRSLLSPFLQQVPVIVLAHKWRPSRLNLQYCTLCSTVIICIYICPNFAYHIKDHIRRSEHLYFVAYMFSMYATVVSCYIRSWHAIHWHCPL